MTTYAICNECDATVDVFRAELLDVAETLQAVEVTAQIHREECHAR